MKRIFVNGVEYGDVDEMPPRVRRIYEARLRRDDGRAGDRSEEDHGPGRGEAPGSEETVVEIDTPAPDETGAGGPMERRENTRIVVDGKEYSDPDTLPPRARELYEYMMSRVADEGPFRGGGPDASPEGRIEVTESRTIHHLHGPHGSGGSPDGRADRGPGSGSNPVLVVVAVIVILLVVSLLT